MLLKRFYYNVFVTSMAMGKLLLLFFCPFKYISLMLYCHFSGDVKVVFIVGGAVIPPSRLVIPSFIL